MIMMSLLAAQEAALFSRTVLASASPRRQEILRCQGGIDSLEVIPSTFEEDLQERYRCFPSVVDYVHKIALGKVTQVAERDRGNQNAASTLYIGADTVVALNGEKFEKPKDEAHARHMLRLFSGKTHQVCTAVVLLCHAPTSNKFITHAFHETSLVKFGELSDLVIDAYVATGEPMDKAGGYGIQGLGAQLVQEITGDFYNVMGFPLFRFCQELIRFCDQIRNPS